MRSISPGRYQDDSMETDTIHSLKQWTHGNERGEGFAVGDPDDSPAEAADRDGWRILRRLEGPGNPVLVVKDHRYAVIADANGPWAVDVEYI